jgi:hypothetical protein
MRSMSFLFALAISCMAQPDRTIDSIFAAIRADSLRVIDSAKAENGKRPVENPSPADTTVPNIAGPQMMADSMAEIVATDSAIERQAGRDFFQNQRVVTIDDKLACIDFLLARHLRKQDQAARYLLAAKILCLDRHTLYYYVCKTVAPEQKAACKNRMDREGDNCAKVQAEMDKLEGVK